MIKIGRTHLQDATPMRLGQEFGGYARQVELRIERIKTAATGLASCPRRHCRRHRHQYASGVRRASNRQDFSTTGLPFREAEDHFEAQAARDAVVHISGA